MGFTTAVAKRDNAMMQMAEAESNQYNKLIQGVREEAEDAEDWTEVGKDGPCSAHVLAALAAFLANADNVAVSSTEAEAVAHQSNMI